MGQSSNAIVTDFYSAITAGDADTVVGIIESHFDEDASVEWPPSLPHGGKVQGARKLKAVFGAAANPDAPGAKNLKLVKAIGDGDDVVAWVSFDFAGTPNEALEVWTFADGKLREIRAFYWNTDAIPGNK